MEQGLHEDVQYVEIVSNKTDFIAKRVDVRP